MTDEQIALARRAVACKGWRWMPGMLTVENFRCIWSDASQIELASYAAYNHRRSHLKSELPSLTDPATLGCLLALVREHHKEPRLAVVPTGKGWSVSRVWLRSPHDRVAGVHTLEADALVAALEAAP
jgi:hypothetical protein